VVASPIAILRHEHRSLIDVADAAEALARKIEARQRVPAPVLAGVGELFSFYAHVLHRDKEEELLFPVLRRLGLRDTGCIGALLAEHEESDIAFGKMQEAAAACADSSAAAESWMKAARIYCERLRYHIRREELLFMNAEQLLPAAEAEELVSQFRLLDDKASRAGLAERVQTLQQLIREAIQA
jgi:hemerythrin-like domain-containing protein